MRVLCWTTDTVDLEFRPTAHVENALGFIGRICNLTSHILSVQKLRGELKVKSLRETRQVWDFETSAQHPRCILWGTLGAMLAGLAWTLSGIVDLATAGSAAPEVLGLAPLDVALYCVALVGML